MVICFDLDGTLLQTHTDIAASINYTLKQFGYPPIPADIQRGFRHYRLSEYLSDVLEHLGLNDSDFAARLGEKHHENYHKFMCTNGEPFEGIVDGIQQLQEKGHKICVLTNKPQFFAEKEIGYWLPDIEFDFILGTIVGETHKPHADFILPLYENIACEASDVVYIGDTFTDWQFAQNCGAHFIGVGWGYDAGDQMRNHAELVCNTMTELLNCISALNHN